jgi:hypothetical protein
VFPFTGQLQQHILDAQQQSLGRVLGSHQSNLVLAWRGKDERNQYRYAMHGVDAPVALTEQEQQNIRKHKPLDYGFFGRGVYFTQYFGYGAEYIDKYPGSPLLLSWVAMGNVYPVTENCATLPYEQHLHGKPCKPGFDSHYVLVHDDNKQPITSTSDTPQADEIVVFDPAQVSTQPPTQIPTTHHVREAVAD